MATYDVFVGQFNRAQTGVSSNMPLHWEICVRTEKLSGPGKKSTGTVFHLIGTPDNWGFERKDNVKYSSPASWNGCTKVGSVDKAKLDEMAQLLAVVPTVRASPQWNCQNWVFKALQVLQQSGYKIAAPKTFTDLQALMAKAKLQWEQGEDSD